MVEIRRYPHLLVDLASYRIPFAAQGGGGGGDEAPPVLNRSQHTQRLTRSLDAAIRAKLAVDTDDPPTSLHVSVSARSSVGVVTGPSFENPRSAMQLLSVKGEGKAQRANLLLSLAKSDTFRRKLDAYGSWDGEGDRRPNDFTFFESVSTFTPTTIEDLWLDDERLLPRNFERAEWEIWVRGDAAQRLRNSARTFGVRFETGEVEFSRVRIMRAHASRTDLQELIDVSGAVIELRACSSLTLAVLDMGHDDSRSLQASVARRIVAPPTEAARVAILDTGVDYSHPMLSPVLPHSRCHSLSPNWPENGWNAHGTRVAGIVLYPDLAETLRGNDPIHPKLNLESVTALRPTDAPRFAREAVGEISAAVELLETAEEARRVFCLAFTSPLGLDNGVPSALSGSVDQLAWGKDGQPRLFCVAAGNILDEPLLAAGYPQRNQDSGITCPGQALNALTVGGCTFVDEHPHDGTLLAGPGDISPTSKTSCSWTNRRIVKPDVVFEAGNHSVEDDVSNAIPELGVLTTNKHARRKFATLEQTSAATAAVAGMAGRIMSDYPNLWPETVRGLIVHSADWTPAMMDRVSAFPDAERKEMLLSMFGYGVPEERRAKGSASDNLTLIIQNEFHPFTYDDNRTTATEMAYHELPWPAGILRSMGRAEIELRITLSYFVEPDLTSSASGKWSRYASHRLGFDIRGPDDDDLDVVRRQNRARLTDRPSRPPSRSESGWMLGSALRERGTLHHDRFKGAARDIARQNGVRVTPKKGWWTDEEWRGEYTTNPIRYALIVSVRSPELKQDIYQQAQVQLRAMSRTRNSVLQGLVRPVTRVGRR